MKTMKIIEKIGVSIGIMTFPIELYFKLHSHDYIRLFISTTLFVFYPYWAYRIFKIKNVWQRRKHIIGLINAGEYSFTAYEKINEKHYVAHGGRYSKDSIPHILLGTIEGMCDNLQLTELTHEMDNAVKEANKIINEK